MNKILTLFLLCACVHFCHGQELSGPIQDRFFGLRFGNAYSEEELLASVKGHYGTYNSKKGIPISIYYFSDLEYDGIIWDLADFSEQTKIENYPGILYDFTLVLQRDLKIDRDAIFEKIITASANKYGKSVSSPDGKLRIWSDGNCSLYIASVDPKEAGEKFGIMVSYTLDYIALNLNK